MNSSFTARKLEVVRLVIEGLTIRQIGVYLGITERTVYQYLNELRYATGSVSVPQLVYKLVCLGVIPIGNNLVESVKNQ